MPKNGRSKLNVASTAANQSSRAARAIRRLSVISSDFTATIFGRSASGSVGQKRRASRSLNVVWDAFGYQNSIVNG
jgi:hypothetical protein